MDVNGVLTRVRSLVGDDAGTFVLLPQIIDLVNDACIDLNIETKIVFTTSVIPTIIGTKAYALPTNFITMKSVDRVNFGKLRPVSRNHVNMHDPVGSSGSPGWYSVDGTQLFLYPTPTAVENVTIEYVCTPTAVDDGADVLPLPAYLHPLVAKLCYAALKERDEDYEAATSIKSTALAEASVRVSIAQSSQEESYPVIRDVDAVYE